MMLGAQACAIRKLRAQRRRVSLFRNLSLGFERLAARLPLDGCGLVVDDHDPVHVHPLYAPDTPPELVDLHPDWIVPEDGSEEGPSFFSFRDSRRWYRTATDGAGLQQGDATTLTWSIVPDGTATVNDINGGLSGQASNLISRLDQIYGTASVPQLEDKVWFELIDDAFSRWSDTSGVEFVYEPNDDGAPQSSANRGQLGVRGDVRLGGHNVDGNGNILAYNYFPDLGEMILDTNDTFYNSTGGNSIRLRNVVAHELGHSLGISHVMPVNQTKLLEPFLTTAFEGPQFDDILAAHRGYGDENEQGSGNDIVANATNLGTLGAGQTVSIGGDATDTFVAPTDTDFVSIDSDVDVDFFRFTASEAATVNVVLRPLGPTYQSGTQGGTPTTFNAASQNNLSLAIFAGDGTSLIGSASAAGLGQDEVLAGLGIPAGDYYIRVSGADDAAQFYQLDVSLDSTTASPTRIMDDGDFGFSTVGSWTHWSGQGYQGDVHEVGAGTGARSASWTFGGLQPGQYQVAATWTAYSNRASDSPFEIYDGGAQRATVRVNQRFAPNDFGDAGVNWERLGNPVLISGTNLTVRMTDDADGNLIADAIRIERIGDVAQAPEIQVFEGAAEISDGTGSSSFGSTTPNTPLTKVFTVKNIGTSDLTLSQPINVPNGYSVVSTFGSTTLAAGSMTTFSVRLDATSEGTYSGQLSFTNNDNDESPFNFNLSGTVATQPPAPVVQIIDNGDTGYSTVGPWVRWTGQGYYGDVDENLAGTGGDSATWQFTGLQPGQYQVAATWTPFSNRASNSPFEIYDGGQRLATIPINQRVAPNDFADAGTNWEHLGGVHAITGTTLSVRLTDDANGNLNADAIRIERVGEVAQAPEIQVFAGADEISDDSGAFAFGSTAPNVPVTQVFTVENVGTQPLTLTGPINVPAGFVVTAGFGTGTLAAGASTTFAIQMTASAEGSFAGQVSFINNDDDESPFNFSISGTVANQPPPPVVEIIDNGDIGYTTVGTWMRWNGQGYYSDVDESLAGTGADVASWTFAGLLPGQYQVAATWSAFSNRASNSPFAVYDGPSELATIRVNQRVAPNDFSSEGTSWEQLGDTYAITGTTLAVRLSDDANGNLNADAIRIERVGGVAQGPEIQLFDGATEVADGSGSVSFGSTTPNTSATKVFTVKNVGTQPLTLTGPISVPPGFTVSSGFSSTSVPVGGSASFSIRLLSASEGSFSGQLSFANNDADESPFNFTISGEVADVPPPPPIQIIDNGDDGYSTVGSWVRWNGQGYQGDVDEHYQGTGAESATWTFAGLQPGQYQVAATWTAYSNRASDSPYMIYNGSHRLATVRVNQRQAPLDFMDEGVNWKRLGSTYWITSTALVVEMTNDANGNLNADAVRIERVGDLAQSAPAADLGQPTRFAMLPLDERRHAPDTDEAPLPQPLNLTDVAIQSLGPTWPAVDLPARRSGRLGSDLVGRDVNGRDEDDETARRRIQEGIVDDLFVGAFDSLEAE